MPLAPLPANNSPRLFLRYQTPQNQHELVMRFIDGMTTADAIASATAYTEAVAPLLCNNVQWTTLRQQNRNSDVSFPVAWLPTQPTSTQELQPRDEPRFFSMTGRSQDGRRVRIMQFGSIFPIDDNYRILRGESAAVDDLIDFIQLTSITFVTISMAEPLWNEYLNLGYNAYYQRQARV